MEEEYIGVANINDIRRYAISCDVGAGDDTLAIKTIAVNTASLATKTSEFVSTGLWQPGSYKCGGNLHETNTNGSAGYIEEDKTTIYKCKINKKYKIFI